MSEGSSTCGTEAARRRGAAGALGGAVQPGRWAAPRRGSSAEWAPVRARAAHVLLRSAEAPPPEAPPCAGAGAPRATGGPLPPRPAPPLPGLTALTGSACLAAHQAGVVDELVHLASVCQARAQGRGQGCASRAPGRRWRACPVLRATSCARAPYYAPPVAWEAAWATCGGRPPGPLVVGGRLGAPAHLRDGGLDLALHEADGGVAQVHDQLVVELLVVRVPRAWAWGVGVGSGAGSGSGSGSGRSLGVGSGSGPPVA